MESLRASLVVERDHIVSAFRQRVREARLLPASMPDGDVVDDLPAMLDAMIAVLGGAETGEVERLAREHADQRLRLGFSIKDVCREYALLRDLMFAAVGRDGVTAEGYAELARLTGEAEVAAVEAFANAKEREVRTQGERHFAFVAHELRNPLTSVRLAVERIRRNAPRVSMPSPQGARPSLATLFGDDAFETLERGLRRLQDLIDNSLVSVKLNTFADPETLVRERVDVRAVANDVAADVGGEAMDKGIELSFDVEPGLCISGDQRIFYSALSNLTRNALKFTRAGGRVEVRAHTTGDDVVVEVEDECGGLDRKAIDKLFDPFAQFGADRSGFGLGLAITRHAAEVHGGSVDVRNVAGKGCVFLLRVPRTACDTTGR